jgi:hypothetical protein
MTQRNLEDIAMLDTAVNQVTQELFNNELEFSYQVGKFGILIADSVVLEERSAQDVLAQANIFSRLDLEAYLVAGGDIENLRDSDHIADYIEATARRLGHHAYRMTDGLIGSYNLRNRHGMNQARRMNAQFGFRNEVLYGVSRGYAL